MAAKIKAIQHKIMKAKMEATIRSNWARKDEGHESQAGLTDRTD
jgi:hypothetical protein